MISVVLPVYNEKGNLNPLYSEIKEVMNDQGLEHETVFVDDGSMDGSLEVLRDLAENENVKVVELNKNFGQSAALQAGFDRSEGEIVVSMDSDMQNDPEDIPRLIDKLNEGYDCVSGWRSNRRDPFLKKTFSRFAYLLRKILLSTDLHDYGCTLKAYRRDCLENVQIYGELHRYIPPLLRWKGYRVTEIEVNHRERNAGETKYGIFRLFKGFLDLFVVAFWQRFSQKPIHIFGGVGILFGGFGGLVGLYMAYRKLFHGVNLSSHFLSTIAFFSVLMGIQLFTSGVIADIALKNYRDEGDIYRVRRLHND